VMLYVVIGGKEDSFTGQLLIKMDSLTMVSLQSEFLTNTKERVACKTFLRYALRSCSQRKP